MYNLITCALVLFVLASCQVPEQKQGSSSAERDPNLPQMKKVEIEEPGQVQNLLDKGLEVIVVEDNYIIVRLASNQISTLADAGLKSTDAAEEDFVQRLIKVTLKDKSDMTFFAEMGLDIWEVDGDVVLARAFDSHIRHLRDQAFSLEIIAENALEYVKKQTAEK